MKKTSLSESCTRFRDVVQIVRNTDWQGYDADDHRDGCVLGSHIIERK